MLLDNEFINSLLDRAKESPRLRQHYDLRNSAADTSQRMLNALLPGTEVAIHRHEETAETVVCLMGKLEEVMYEEHTDENGGRVFKEVRRQVLAPAEGLYGMQIPAGTWHTVKVIEPTVILEAKDGPYKK